MTRSSNANDTMTPPDQSADQSADQLASGAAVAPEFEAGGLLELQWSGALAAPHPPTARRATLFTVQLHLVDPTHALLEARTPTRLVAQYPVRLQHVIDEDLLHVDAWKDDRRVLAVSLAHDGQGHPTPIFARCTLLADAGLTAGACDPPTVKVRAATGAAASA